MPDNLHVAVSNRHPRLRLDRQQVGRAIGLLAAARPGLGPRNGTAPGGELSVVFMTDAALATLHGDFMGDPTPTDVITFGGDPAAGTAGEICVSADTAARVARDRSLEFATELTLYVVHGWLHLAGHDDLEPRMKRLMRRAEKRALALLRRHSAIPGFRLVSTRRG